MSIAAQRSDTDAECWDAFGWVNSSRASESLIAFGFKHNVMGLKGMGMLTESSVAGTVSLSTSRQIHVHCSDSTSPRIRPSDRKTERTVFAYQIPNQIQSTFSCLYS